MTVEIHDNGRPKWTEVLRQLELLETRLVEGRMRDIQSLKDILHSTDSRLTDDISNIKGDVRAVAAKVDALLITEATRTGGRTDTAKFKISLREWSAFLVSLMAVTITLLNVYQ